MADKKLIQQRFLKNFKNYNKNALVQDIMAEKLLSALTQTCGCNFGNVFEFGAGTAQFTKKIVRYISCENYFSNDIVEESREFTEEAVKNAKFICGDVEETQLPQNMDLITANAVFQWIENPQRLLQSTYESLNESGIMAFTTFGVNNCVEISNILDISLKYYDLPELKNFFSNSFETIFLEDELIKLSFATPYEVLRHLKLTGTNAIEEKKFTKSTLKIFCEKYKQLYSHGERVELTYHPIYVILKKS